MTFSREDPLKLKQKIKKLRKTRLPWLPILWRPRYRLKIPTPDVSKARTRTIGFFLFLIMASLLLGGLVYSAVELPPPLVTVGQQKPGFIVPRSIQSQTTTEVFIISMIFLLASIGTFIVSKSSRELTNEEGKVDIELYVGYALIFLALTSILVIYSQKAGMM